MTEKLLTCPWCTPTVYFFTQTDLSAHLKAAITTPPPANAPAINRTDHLNHYKQIHSKLERGY